MSLTKIRKALVGGAAAFGSALLAAAVQHGGWPGWPEVGVALGAGVVAGWAVWRVPYHTGGNS